MPFNKELYKLKLNECKKGDKDIYNHLNISKTGLWCKVNNKSHFTDTEISSLKDFLNLTDEDMYLIFFNDK